jgi:hypothetical protein
MAEVHRLVQQVPQRVTDAVGQGSLKLVSGWSPSRSLDQLLETTLTERVGAADVRQLYDHTYLVFTDA